MYIFKTGLIKSLLKSMSSLKPPPVNGYNILSSLKFRAWMEGVSVTGCVRTCRGIWPGILSTQLLRAMDLRRVLWLCIHLLCILRMFLGNLVVSYFKSTLLPGLLISLTDGWNIKFYARLCRESINLGWFFFVSLLCKFLGFFLFLSGIFFCICPHFYTVPSFLLAFFLLFTYQ